MLKKERADYIQQRLNQLYPETPIPLDHKNNFELLVAVLLSAQCTDIRVNQITPALFAEADNAFDMQHVPVDSIYKIVRPCGLAPQKSSAISNLSKILVEQYNGEVPDDWEALESLPGVGHKTASVVMSQGFGHPAFPVDTHIHRLAQRWGLTKGKKRDSYGKRFKKTISPRTVECPASADNFLWSRILLSARLRWTELRDLQYLLSKPEKTIYRP